MKEITGSLFKAGPDREGGSEKNLKTTVLLPFPTLGQDDLFDANYGSDYLMVFKSKFVSVFKNLDGPVDINEKFHI